MLDTIRAGGDETVVPGTDMPGGGRLAWFRDPSGNVLVVYRAADDD